MRPNDASGGYGPSVAEVAYRAFTKALPAEDFPPYHELPQEMKLAWTAAAMAALQEVKKK